VFTIGADNGHMAHAPQAAMAASPIRSSVRAKPARKFGKDTRGDRRGG
jgi:hypothetical protein